MIYLIGGTPRCGKTTILEECIKLRPVAAASTDALREILRTVDEKNKKVLTKVPNLLLKERRYDLLSSDANTFIGYYTDEAELVFENILPFIDEYVRNNRDLIIEGIAITPSLASTLHFDHKAIFVGNQDVNLPEHLHAFAKENPADWINRYNLTESEIAAFGNFLITQSKWFEAEAINHRYQYTEMSEGDFPQNIQRVAKELML